jgi:DNA modification methylase
LQRAKYALWYGDIETYDFNGAHYGDAGDVRIVSNTRGAYTFKPDSRGKHLSDVFSFPITQLHSSGEHTHEKPIDWLRMLLGNCTPDNALVYDPFLGSGTTLIAAHRTGRRGYGCEIEPRYADVILRRAESEGLTVEQ